MMQPDTEHFKSFVA